MKRLWLPLAILAILLTVVVVGVVGGRGQTGGPPMTALEITGAAGAITTSHPTPAESADLAHARALGLSNAQIRAAAWGQGG